MKRFLKVSLLFLIGCLIAAFAVANRHPVRLIADPFINRDRAWSVEAPLYVYLFIALFAGLFLGAAAVWSGQRHWRKAAHLRSKEAALWKREAETLKAGFNGNIAGAPAATPQIRSYL
jgi:uncharacterized integral membrane protein